MGQAPTACLTLWLILLRCLVLTDKATAYSAAWASTAFCSKLIKISQRSLECSHFFSVFYSVTAAFWTSDIVVRIPRQLHWWTCLADKVALIWPNYIRVLEYLSEKSHQNDTSYNSYTIWTDYHTGWYTTSPHIPNILQGSTDRGHSLLLEVWIDTTGLQMLLLTQPTLARVMQKETSFKFHVGKSVSANAYFETDLK